MLSNDVSTGANLDGNEAHCYEPQARSVVATE